MLGKWTEKKKHHSTAVLFLVIFIVLLQIGIGCNKINLIWPLSGLLVPSCQFLGDINGKPLTDSKNVSSLLSPVRNLGVCSNML